MSVSGDKKRMQFQFEKNLELQNAQNEWNKQMYLDYNSPEAMAQQYRNAGFNPAMMMTGSTGPTAAPTNGSPTSIGLTNSDNYDLLGMLNQTLGTLGSVGQSIFTDINTNANTNIQNQNLLEAKETYDTRKQTLNQSLENMKKDGLLKDEEVKQMKVLNDYLPYMKEGELQSLNKTIEKMDSEISLNKTNKDKVEEEINEIITKEHVNEAQAAKIWTERQGQVYMNKVYKYRSEICEQLGIDPEGDFANNLLIGLIKDPKKLTNALTKMITSVADVAEELPSGWEWLLGKGKGATKWFWNDLKGTVSGMWNSYDSAVGNVVEGIDNVLTNIMKNAEKTMKGYNKGQFNSHKNPNPFTRYHTGM